MQLLFYKQVLDGFIEPRTFKDYYEQMLTRAGLRKFTFHALRHTFASRALEQRMDVKALSILLGHYLVSFTLDAYTHVLNDRMQLMNDLCSIDRSTSQNTVYPVVGLQAISGLIRAACGNTARDVTFSEWADVSAGADTVI